MFLVMRDCIYSHDQKRNMFLLKLRCLNRSKTLLCFHVQKDQENFSQNAAGPPQPNILQQTKPLTCNLTSYYQ